MVRSRIGIFVALAMGACAASTIVTVAYLALTVESPLHALGLSARTARATSAEPIAGRFRRAIGWLDTITTASGAHLWPGVANVCGLPRR